MSGWMDGLIEIDIDVDIDMKIFVRKRVFVRIRACMQYTDKLIDRNRNIYKKKHPPILRTAPSTAAVALISCEKVMHFLRLEPLKR